MAEEFVDDIISAAEATDGSSTEATAVIDNIVKSAVVAINSGDDQSSNQTKTLNGNADSDQTKIAPSVEEPSVSVLAIMSCTNSSAIITPI